MKKLLTLFALAMMMLGVQNANAIVYTALSGSNWNAGEGPAKLFDGTTNTKWGTHDDDPYVVFKTSSPIKPSQYKLVIANDTYKNGNNGRNWKNWKIYAGNFASESEATRNASGWVLIDNKQNQSLPTGTEQNPFAEQTLSISESVSTEYSYFKIEIEALAGNWNDYCQMDGFTFTTYTLPVGTVEFTCTAKQGNNGTASEGMEKLFDGVYTTKYCGNASNVSGANPVYAIVEASEAIYVWGYDMTTAEDNELYGRCVTGWTLYGSNDAAAATDANHSSWSKLSDLGTNSFVQRKNYYTQRFFCDKDKVGTAYKYYKLTLDDGGFVQLTEFKLCYEKNALVTYSWYESTKDASKNAVDWKLNTKWGGSGGDALVGNSVTIKTDDDASHSVKSYSFTTDDDGYWTDRAPKEWRIEGSNDNSNWVTIHEVTGTDPIDNLYYKTFEFTPSNVSDAFKYIKLTLLTMKGNGYQQIGEFHVVGSCENHTWVDLSYVAPTCVSDGGGERQCSVCGVKTLTGVEPATGVHTYTDGYCTVCGRPDPNFMTANAGFYEPTTVAQFNWLAAMIQAHETVNIRLTQDVDLTGFAGFGNGEEVNDHLVPFSGEFDGGGHWIKNFNMNVSKKNSGLFGVTNGANIHDLGFDDSYVRNFGCQNVGTVVGDANNTTINRVAIMNGSYVEGYDHVGAIVGNAKGSTVISNCISDAEVKSSNFQCGGLVGTSSGLTLEKCLFRGSVNGSGGNASGLLSLIESNNATILQNNIMAATKIETSSSDNYHSLVNAGGRTATYTNNHVAASTIFKASGSDDTELKAGKTLVFDEINGSQGKTTDVEDMQTANFYTSTMGWDMTNDWTFIAEGHYPVLKWMVDFISTPAELVAFANKVNGGGITTAALLTADVNMSSTPHASIGSEGNKFSGIFNGQGHVVTLNITSNQEFQGLIGCAEGGSEIMNVITRGSVSGPARSAGVLGGSKNSSGTITLTNCGNEANVTVTGQNAAGIVGCNSGSGATYILTNCYNTGTIKGGSESAGISGWLGSGATVTNCYNIGSVTGDQDGRTFTRSDGDGCDHINCYSSLNVNHYSGVITTNYSMDKVHSGELCMALGNAFTQDLSQADSHPTFGFETVDRGQWFSDDYIYYNVDESGNITVYQLNLSEENTVYNVPANVTATNISVARTIPAGQWIGLCLPFDYDIPSGWDVREMTGVSGSGENVSMKFSTASTIEAGKPYIVNPEATVTTIIATDKAIAESATDVIFGGITMKGRLKKDAITTGDFYINTSSQLKKLTAASATLKGFRAYFTVDGGSGVKALSFDFDDDATGISQMEDGRSKMEGGAIYNVAGQRMSKMQKGINIINGKKILK